MMKKSFLPALLVGLTVIASLGCSEDKGTNSSVLPPPPSREEGNGKIIIEGGRKNTENPPVSSPTTMTTLGRCGDGRCDLGETCNVDCPGIDPQEDLPLEPTGRMTWAGSPPKVTLYGATPIFSPNDEVTSIGLEINTDRSARSGSNACFYIALCHSANKTGCLSAATVDGGDLTTYPRATCSGAVDGFGDRIHCDFPVANIKPDTFNYLYIRGCTRVTDGWKIKDYTIAYTLSSGPAAPFPTRTNDDNGWWVRGSDEKELFGPF